MSKLSLCMIMKNEESILQQSLESIYQAVDELIIVDTGSTDRSIEIAKKFTDKIYHFEWINDFSAARNFCTQFATGDYILRWDADFVLRNKSQINDLLKLKKANFQQADLIHFTWNLEFNEKNEPIKRHPNFFIYKKEKFYWDSPIHNCLIQKDGNAIKELFLYDIEVDHYKDPKRKAHRYHQTNQIISELLKNRPNDLRLIFNHAEGLLHQNRYEEAKAFFTKYLELFEKIPHNEPKLKKELALECAIRCAFATKKLTEAQSLLEHFPMPHSPIYQLIYADFLMLTGSKEAEKAYQNYLNAPYPNIPGQFFDHERYHIHPYIMLFNIYLRQKRYKEASSAGKYILSNTLLNTTKEKVTLMLLNINE